MDEVQQCKDNGVAHLFSMILIKNRLLQSVTNLFENHLIDCGDGEAILEMAEEQSIEMRWNIFTHCHLEIITDSQ